MRRALVILMSVLVALPACAAGQSATTTTTTRAVPVVYAAVGASDTVGVGADDPGAQGWPAVFYRSIDPPEGSRYVNLGISGAKVQTAIDRELAQALAARPTLVTVWLNTNDIIGLVPVATYESQLKTLVHALRQEGRARVLVANTPPLDALPKVKPLASAVAAVLGPFNEAVRRVVDAEGAELVDLNAAGRKAIEAGTFASLVAGDGFHPSTAGHAAVAAEFAAVYRRSR